MFDPQICVHVAGAMTELQRLACNGYTGFRHGTVPVDQAQLLADRFDRRYHLSQSEDQRSHARRKGKASHRLVMFPGADRREIHWWLLRTPGSCDDDQRKWQLMPKHRLEWIWWYELVRLPVPPAHRKKYQQTLRDGTQGNHRPDAKSPEKAVPRSAASMRPRINAVTWTWRIKVDQVQKLKQDIRFYVFKRDHRLAQLLLSLRRTPGFRGVRGDVFELYRYLQRQCRKQGVPCPELPATIPWVRNQHYARVPLSALVKRAASGAQSWFE